MYTNSTEAKQEAAPAGAITARLGRVDVTLLEDGRVHVAGPASGRNSRVAARMALFSRAGSDPLEASSMLEQLTGKRWEVAEYDGGLGVYLGGRDDSSTRQKGAAWLSIEEGRIQARFTETPQHAKLLIIAALALGASAFITRRSAPAFAWELSRLGYHFTQHPREGKNFDLPVMKDGGKFPATTAKFGGLEASEANLDGWLAARLGIQPLVDAQVPIIIPKASEIQRLLLWQDLCDHAGPGGWLALQEWLFAAEQEKARLALLHIDYREPEGVEWIYHEEYSNMLANQKARHDRGAFVGGVLGAKRISRHLGGPLRTTRDVESAFERIEDRFRKGRMDADTLRKDGLLEPGGPELARIMQACSETDGWRDESLPAAWRAFRDGLWCGTCWLLSQHTT